MPELLVSVNKSICLVKKEASNEKTREKLGKNNYGFGRNAAVRKQSLASTVDTSKSKQSVHGFLTFKLSIQFLT